MSSSKSSYCFVSLIMFVLQLKIAIKKIATATYKLESRICISHLYLVSLWFISSNAYSQYLAILTKNLPLSDKNMQF